MIHRMFAVATLACVVAPLGVARVSAQDVDVKALKYSESRSKQYIQTDKSKKFSGSFETATITLLLHGKAAESATHYGKIKITKAVDDTGNDLNPATGRSKFTFGGQSGFQELNRKHMWFFEDNPPKDKVKIDVSIGQPPRAATKIVALEGTMTLKAATFKDVTIANPAKLVGKPVSDPLLKSAGATVTISKFDAKKRQVELKITDPNERVNDYDVVDASGKEISQGHSAWSINNAKTVTLPVSKLPAGAKIKLVVATSSTEVDVPFKLSNLDLP